MGRVRGVTRKLHPVIFRLPEIMLVCGVVLFIVVVALWPN